MAERIEGLSIGLDLDTIALDRGLKGLKDRLKTVNSEMKANMSAFDRGDKSVEKYQTRLDGLNKKLEVQKRTTKEAKAEYEKMVKEHGEGSIQAEKAAREYNNQASALNNLERYIERTTEELKQLKRENSTFSRLGKSIRSFGDGLKSISGKVRGIGQNLTRNITMPAAAAASALTGIALVKGFDRLVGIDNAKAKLKGLGHEAESVEIIMESALESVKGTAHGMDEAATTAASAVAAGIKPGKDLTRYLSLTGDAAAIAGTSMAEMGSIINQVQTGQVAYTDNLNQLADRGIPIYQWLGKEAGVAASEVKKMASDGKISSEMFLKAIEDNIGGAAQKMGEESFTAGLSNMWAAVGRLGANFLDAGGKGGGFFSKLKPLISDFTKRIDSMGGIAEKAGEKFGEFFTNIVDKVKAAKARYDELAPSIQTIIKRVAVIGSVVAVAMGPVLTFGGLFIGLIGNIMTAMAPVMASIAKAGGLLKWLKLGFAALTGPIGITIGIITLLTTGFIALYSKSETFRNGVHNLIQKIKELTQDALKALRPAIDAVVKFFQDQLATIQKFWQENGKTIMEALSNVWKFIKTVFDAILKVIQFVMPFILAIIKSVWENIKGVITGVLNVIMGAVKFFSGLLTGDFSKMWEGIKQMFKGAVEFVWNWINLMFIGRILKDVGGFATNLVKSLKGGWDKAIGGIKSFVGTAKSWFDDLLKNGKQKFDDLVTAAKNLPQKIGDGIKNMAGKVTDGVKSVANKMTEALGNGVNGVIGGVNWVLGKIGIKNLIPLWSVPQYAEGTKGAHPGGLAVVGDGKGSNAGRELISTPDGKSYLSPDKPTILNLPKGTHVLSAALTKELIPHYANGTGWLSSAWEGTKKVATKIKDTALDVWEYISDPSKLFNKALKLFGVETPSFPGILKDMGKGLFNKAKDSLKTFLKDKIDGFGGGNVATTGSGVQRWAGIATRALMMTGQYTKSNLDRLLYQMQTESGGNPRAINLWDINAKRGTPSKGLMQVIDPTFRAYAMPGYNKNIWDPLSNILASIRYAVRRYGTLGRAYRGVGYATGGLINSEGLYQLAEGGWPEWIIPTDPSRRTDAMKLLALAGKQITGNKRPHELPNVNDSSTSNDSLLQAVLEQNRILLALLQSSRNIEEKPIISERDIGRANERYDAKESSKHSIFNGRGAFA